MRRPSWVNRLLPPEPSIFISYRREDSAGHATLLLDKLKSWYGTRSIFLDHDAIEGGAAFSDALDDALARADVTVVVIGPSWADAERAGRRRLDDPDDWVRREVATSLERTDVRVIPVLVGGAELPAASELPDELELLPALQAITVRTDRIDDDVRLLTRAIGGWRRRVLGLSLRMWGVCGVVLALGLVGALVVWPPDHRPPVISDHLRASVTQGQSVELDLLGVVSTDDPDSLSVAADEFSEHGGRVVAEAPGFVLYTSPPDFHGVDRFDFVVTDGAGARAEGAAFITVALGPMVGDFNVAVAEFTEVRDEGVPAVTTRSSELARTVSDRIADDLGELNRSEGFNFGVRGPGDVGPALGASELDRAAAASELSAEVGADVVLYGVATAEGFAPEFYLSDQDGHLEGAEELGGQYELGSTILGSVLGTGSVTDNAIARRELTARIDALIDFVIGLSWIQSGEFVSAEMAFQDADVPEWRDRDGKEILHLFLGTVAGNQGSPEDLTRAADQYRRALELNRDYARALVGLATVQFFQAKIDCEAERVDVAGLEEAATTYRSALSADDRPAVSNIEPKVALGLARIDTCLSQALVEDRWADAEAEFQAVVDEFEAGNDAVRTLAVESYAGLALIALPFEDDPVPGPALCRALSLYETAADLSEHADQIAAFASNREHVEVRLAELGATCG